METVSSIHSARKPHRQHCGRGGRAGSKPDRRVERVPRSLKRVVTLVCCFEGAFQNGEAVVLFADCDRSGTNRAGVAPSDSRHGRDVAIRIRLEPVDAARVRTCDKDVSSSVDRDWLQVTKTRI